MKALFLIFYLLSSSDSLACEIKPASYQYGIEDGWYEATVRYNNFSTGTYSTYTLDVKVQKNKVARIDFGNGGSVHDGYNNSGYIYIYSGGFLNFDKNYNGDIIAASTSVTVYEGSVVKTFNIRIE